MRVTVCQWDSRPQTLEQQFVSLLAHLHESRTELLLLPEMPFDDWLAVSPDVDVSRWDASVQQHQDWLERFPKNLQLHVLASRPVVDLWGIRRNRAFYWNAAEGLVDGHDKAHLPDEEGYWEAHWYPAGSPRLKAFDLGGCRAGSLICSELWFFEHARSYAQQQAHLLCLSRATSTYDADNWLAAGRTAAVVAGAYCLSSNQYRPDGVMPEMAGGGWVIDPDGNLLALTSEDEPFITLDIDLLSAESAKTTYPRYVQ